VRQNPARQVAFNAGLPVRIPEMTINNVLMIRMASGTLLKVIQWASPQKITAPNAT
jgi:hypothetical protein